MNEWMNEMKWNEMKWMSEWMNEMKWNEMKWNEMNEWMNECIYTHLFFYKCIGLYVCFADGFPTACLMMFVRLRHADNLWWEHAFHAKTGKGIPWHFRGRTYWLIKVNDFNFLRIPSFSDLFFTFSFDLFLQHLEVVEVAELADDLREAAWYQTAT